jgi:type I restriction enzyme R subunit
VREDAPPYGGESLGDELRPARWTYTPHTDILRQLSDVMVEPWVREALIRLNPEVAAQPDRADEVIYNLRACILSVQADGLVRANENFMAWLRGEKTMPFGHNGEHVPVRLVDAVQPATIGSPSPTSGFSKWAPWKNASTWYAWSMACRWSSARPRHLPAVP